jgi:hypothetical protein
MSAPAVETSEFEWSVQPHAAELVAELLADIETQCAAVRSIRRRLLEETGTRLQDWVDHLVLPEDDRLAERLVETGFSNDDSPDGLVWRHPGGLFPAIRFYPRETRRVVLKVDSVTDFLFAHRLFDRDIIDGSPLAPIRRSRVAVEGCCELWVIERHGTQALTPLPADAQLQSRVLDWGEAFRFRRRDFEHDADGFDFLATLVRRASRDLGRARACDLFFKAERQYWQARNRAAGVQKARQDTLGLGWGNHDHHTYRSSRAHFARLVSVLESLGFECRERFYAGREAGWGAQVLEQPACGITIFADVDLSPEEVSEDFAHRPLAPRAELGTVGLWCRLHGEAILQAGMHHLECQFDYEAARRQLEAEGIPVMKPFTDLPYLRQAFTRGEVWPVDAKRVEALLREDLITSSQADKFRAEGAIGSHMEILQRDEGYKGFNQSGVNEIIRATDPRMQSA